MAVVGCGWRQSVATVSYEGGGLCWQVAAMESCGRQRRVAGGGENQRRWVAKVAIDGGMRKSSGETLRRGMAGGVMRPRNDTDWRIYAEAYEGYDGKTV